MCDFWCLFRSPDVEKALLQRIQPKDFSPVCNKLCVLRWPDPENALPQRVQPKGFSPVCDILCVLSLFDVEKALLHWVQAIIFSPVCNIFICVFRLLDLEKSLPHCFQCFQCTGSRKMSYLLYGTTGGSSVYLDLKNTYHKRSRPTLSPPCWTSDVSSVLQRRCYLCLTYWAEARLILPARINDAPKGKLFIGDQTSVRILWTKGNVEQH